jgi:hypothetical protein
MESIGRTTVTAAGSLWWELGETCLEQISTGRKIFPSQEEGMGCLSAKGLFTYATSWQSSLPTFVFATANEAGRYTFSYILIYAITRNLFSQIDFVRVLHSYLCHNKESLQSDRFCKGLTFLFMQ